MAGRPLISVFFLVLALVMGLNVLAQTPAASTGCTNSISSLSPCSGFLTGGGSSAALAPACCSAFARVTSGASSCLCQLFGTSNPLGISINPTQVFALPGLCNVNSPPLTQCAAAGIPVGAPTSADVPVNPPVAAPPGSSPAGALPSPGPSPTVNPPTATVNPPTTSVGVPPAESPAAPSGGSNPGNPGSNPGNPISSGTNPSSNDHPITNVGSGADTVFTQSAFHLVAALLVLLCI